MFIDKDWNFLFTVRKACAGENQGEEEEAAAEVREAVI